jgi:cell division septal protein FtsQ
LRPLRSKVKRKGGPGFSAKLMGALKRFTLLSLPYVLSLTLVGVLLGSVVAYAVNSPTFQLSQVKILNLGTMTQDQAFAFCELKRGENLVTLDLVNVQQMVKKKHPEFKEVRVQRVLPNRIEVYLKRRTPIAQVSFSKYVQVDKDLILLPGSSETPFKNLTIIEGAPAPKYGVMVGATLNDSATVKALKLSEIIKRSNVLKTHALTKIDIRDPKNISFFVDGDIEIKIGNSHYIERLKILNQTLKTVELDPAKIRYIDLRFDDIIIGPR